jgi:hypothetical protein
MISMEYASEGVNETHDDPPCNGNWLERERKRAVETKVNNEQRVLSVAMVSATRVGAKRRNRNRREKLLWMCYNRSVRAGKAKRLMASYAIVTFCPYMVLF